MGRAALLPPCFVCFAFIYSRQRSCRCQRKGKKEEGEKGWINYFNIEVTCSLLLASDSEINWDISIFFQFDPLRLPVSLVSLFLYEITERRIIMLNFRGIIYITKCPTVNTSLLLSVSLYSLNSTFPISYPPSLQKRSLQNK